MSARSLLTFPVIALTGLVFSESLVARSGDNPPPPREIPLVEKPQSELSIQEADKYGQIAFSIEPRKWKHAESENFVVHFRRATEARRVIREVEYVLWYTARVLHKSRADYQKKSHIFIFSGSGDWRSFLSEIGAPEWTGSFAHRDNLYLNIGGAVEKFDSILLAHEVSHAAVARLYPDQRWPLWLNEGLAEYVGSASVAERRGQTLKGLQRQLGSEFIPLDELLQMTRYPEDTSKVPLLYRSSERVVRYLMTHFPPDLFPQFVEATLAGSDFQTAITSVYSEQVPDYSAFLRDLDASGR